MTVTYTAEVATCSKFGCFIKLLARWKGSVYKLIWMDLLLFLALYYSNNLVYMYLLNENSKRTFESIVYYCASYTALIPLSFVLGFYVNLVMTRWWEQYITIPWPDSIAVFVSAHVQGQDEGSRLMRRTVMRYVCLCLTLVFTMISPCVKKRFPKLQNLVEAGLLLENEKSIFETMDLSFPNYPKHWMPIVWAASIITRARKEGRIRDDFAVKTIIDELNTFRGRCGSLMYYDFIGIPLVYTQVVTIAVYSFFACSLWAHQWTDVKRDTYERLDFYLPIFITLQFLFYMGWLKVAETLINPFGEDDDDFEVNWMIDRNLQVSYLIVDEMHHEHPELVKDQYWDEVYPNELPYQLETKREQPPEPSTAKYDLEDKPRSSLTKTMVSNKSVILNAKRRSSLLSQRSLRLSQAFQSFSLQSEEVFDASSSNKTDVEASMSSIEDIEDVQRITSYTSSEEYSINGSQLKDVNIWPLTRLETVSEEGEEAYKEEEVEEEELFIEEEEADKIYYQSSYDSDSDSDPFERLRIERIQQRYQRMNDYLERNFGPNFRIVTLPLNIQEKLNKKQFQKEQPMAESTLLYQEQFQEQTLLEEPTLCGTSTPVKETDGSLISIESNLRNLLDTIDLAEVKSKQEQDFVENETFNVTTPTVRFSIAIEHTESISQLSYNPQLRSQTCSELTISTLRSSTGVISNPMEMTKPENSHTSSATQPFVDEIEITLDNSSITAKRADENTSQSSGYIPPRLSIGTSPMGSIISISSESSFESDDWELLDRRKTSGDRDHRVDIEKRDAKQKSHKRN